MMTTGMSFPQKEDLSECQSSHWRKTFKRIVYMAGFQSYILPHHLSGNHIEIKTFMNMLKIEHL